MKTIIITAEALAAIKQFGPRITIDNTERLADGTHRVPVDNDVFHALHAAKHPLESLSDVLIRKIARLTNQLN
ncbi:hypothetical protein [Hyphomicrobium sp. CS1BSMeth3]|uniref:hypothetical protein n=1 Tax=Hyphomicrobium sp. CS1BSMeth3 TaxID=1892844 RepID=UPI0009313DA9|nr:hypothetical protein [Hyphomicrobium sp. CS1BSMeth3]